MIANLNLGELNGRRILSVKSYDLLWKPTTATTIKGIQIGIGWYLGNYSGHRIVAHNGGDTGFSSYIMLVPEKKIGIIMASNWERTNTQAITLEILELILSARNPQA